MKAFTNDEFNGLCALLWPVALQAKEHQESSVKILQPKWSLMKVLMKRL